MKLDMMNFIGSIPRLLPTKLPPNAASETHNVVTKDGLLKPLKGFGADLGETLNVGTQTIFNYPSGAGFWFSFNDDADVVLSPVSGNNENRVYWTRESTVPQMSVASVATNGVAPYPTVSYDLGVPRPDSAITGVVSGTASATPDENVGLIYTYTYVTEYGEESQPADVSTMYTVGPDQTNDLTIPGTGPSGNYNVQTKRIYRSDGGGDYLFLAEIPVAQTAYSDTTDPYTVGGESLASWDWDPPVSGLKGLTSLPNGVTAGFVNNEVYLSESYRPHAFPSQYKQRFSYDVVGLANFSQGAIVFTQAKNYLLYGYDPLSMQTAPVDLDQPCVSKRSIADAGEYAVFAGPDGLCLIGAEGGQIISAGVLNAEDWQALNPESIHGYVWQSWYVGFYDNGTQGCFLFPLGTRDHIIYSDLYCDAAYKVPGESTLTCAVNDSLVKWIGGTEQAYRYKTKEFEFKGDTIFTALRVQAESYNSVSVKVYLNGALWRTETVADDGIVNMPMQRCKSIQVEVESTDIVRKVELGGNAWELAA